MNTRAKMLAVGVVIAGTIVSVWSTGCGDDDPTDTAPARLARKGEACQTSNDCAAGLACLPSSNGGGTCVVGVFNVTQTAKECAIIECQQAADCCDEPSSSCSTLKDLCDRDLAILADAGSSGTTPSSCTQYEASCVCDATKRDCENGKCIVKCVNDSTCSINGSGGKCLGGKCAQCASDDDCKKGNASSDLACVSGVCKAPCQGDGDCAGFDRCLSGKCVESGCQTNRECIAATRNVEASCGTDGKCIVPCQTDLECGNPKGYSFYSCVSGKCLYMGCESDKDCRLLLTGSGSSSSSTSSSTSSSSSGGTLTSKQHVVCRDKPVPNATTQPAK